MASLSDIRRRIGSVKNTRQITRAMKLVAGAKLRRATEAAMAARPYSEALTRVLGRVVEATGDVEHPLLTVPDNEVDVLVVVMSSDRGLCGAFNGRLCRDIQGKVDAEIEAGKTVKMLAYGRKGRDYFKKRGYDVVEAHTQLDPADYTDHADRLSARLVEDLTGSRFSRAMLAYNSYRSVMVQEPTYTQLLPMSLEDSSAEDAGASTEYLFEPDGQTLLGSLLPMALRTRIFQAFLETQAGEQASRMTAMDSATRNASDLIDSLTLEYNRARQANITKELIEIVSGAEAL
ncbi:MAG: ATP synthase F1 subunit gamma [Myxococcota bacterium]|jgi:F-type H+-transporting ATPase subunit gamma|nr:ATP synthase F1 subunit gamma [Myxococcota bacterium]